jgi:multiple sugar transport system permease protein
MTVETAKPRASEGATAAGRPKRAQLSEGAKAERRLGWLLCAPAVIVMVAVTAYPIAYAIYLSLERYDLRFPQDAKFIGFDNYGAVLSSPYWWSALTRTLIITVVSVVIELVLGMLLALLMHRTLFGRGSVRTSILVPYGIVTVVAAFSWQYAWTPGIGYLASLLGPNSAPLTHQVQAIAIIILAEVWKTTPFMALLLMAGLALVPDDLLKAAAMDGAGAWQRFTKVIVPVMKPAILVALLFRTLDAFRIFDNLFVLTPGQSSVSIQNYNNLIRGLNLGVGSTMSVLIFITVAIIAFVFIKIFGTAAPGSDTGGKR